MHNEAARWSALALLIAGLIPTGNCSLTPCCQPPCLHPRQRHPIRGQTFLSDFDLQNIKSQEWGSRVLTIVGTRNWHHLRREQTACQYLAKRCCLCDHFFGRAQELHQHLKIMHPEFWPHTMIKGKMLTQMYGEDPPCPFCTELFKNCHQCTVWTQIALLLVYGGGSADMTAEQSNTIRTCDICNETFTSQELLHTHLVQEHRLTSSSFNPARDCVDGEPACIHCGALYDSLESLRSHINQGRCDQFDPSLPTEVIDVRDIWRDALCSGQLANVLRDPHNRLQLTLRCQHCSLRFQRPNDLAGHLVSAHSQLWQASQGLTHLFMELLYEMTGCLCNPGIAQVRTNHVCVPLRQLSMLFLRLDGQILFPHTPTEAELALLVSQRLDRSSRFLIEQIITERQLTQLWHHDMLLTLLRGTCLLCAEQHGAADLQLHLYEVHKCGTPLVKFFIQQLLPRFMDVNDTDYKCYACLQVFNTSASTAEVAPDPDRTQAALAHFRAQCPCLLQVAILLAKTAHGRHGHGRSHGSRRTDPCSLPASDPDAGPQSEVVPKCTAQKTTKRKSTADSGRKTRTRTAVSEKGQSGQRLDPHGQACHQVGQGSAADEERGHISFLFRQQRKRGKPPHPGASNRDMGPGGHRAQRAEDDIPSDATAPEAGHGLVPDPSDADQPIGEAPEDSDIRKAAIHNKVLLPDLTCPYLEWNHEQKTLQVSRKQPLTLKRLLFLCKDMLEALQDSTLVMKFHALPSTPTSVACPWKMQISIRADQPWQVLQEMAHSAIWLLVGCNLKQHSLQQSSLAFNLQRTLQLPSQPKGKGKSKGKHQKTVKAEA